MKIYHVNEIFESVQGEGSQVGKLCVFVRFSRCNMKCTFCDTDFKSHTDMNKVQILMAAKEFKSRHVVFTGGEPMLQLDEELTQIFKDNGFFIQVETNGSKYLPGKVKYVDYITVSPKDPHQWEQKWGHDLKFLVDKDCFDILDDVKEDTDFVNYYLQPIDDKFALENRERAMELQRLHPDWKLSLQIHKFLNIK